MSQFTTADERGWDRRKMDEIVSELESEGAEIIPIPQNAGALEYELFFKISENSIVFVRLLIGNWQDDSDLVITNLVNTPKEERGKGTATKVISTLTRWASVHSFNEIRATQVTDARCFWEKNGFVRMPEPNHSSDYIRKI